MLNPLSRLESLEIIGVKLGLENIRALLDALGNPQEAFSSILIAGTNGKGSVGAMLAEILRCNGYRVGHYVSPHLTDVRERVRINNEWIPSNEFETLLGSIFSTTDRLLDSGKLKHPPTYFETLTALAFLHFKLQAVDWGVVEVGMGGRFDATNVLNQQLSVITSLDYDHEVYLGKTLAEIAGEKAGIIKRKNKVVTGILPDEARAVIARTAEAQSAEWIEVDPGWIAGLALVEGFPVFRYTPWEETIRVNLRGAHQAQNAATALLALRFLPPSDRRAARKALDQVQWPARLDLRPGSPPVLLDCAHNPMGARALAAYLEDVGWTRVVCLFSAMQDKNYAAMLRVLSPDIESLVVTRVEPLRRCATARQLEKAAVQAGLARPIFERDAVVAFDRAKQEAARKNLPLVIFGSMYLVGAVLKTL